MIVQVLTILVLIVLAIVFIAWPWLKRLLSGAEVVVDDDSLKKLDGSDKVTENEELMKLYSQRDAVFAAIEELEFDVESGTISNEDFDALKQSYRAKAASILKEIDVKAILLTDKAKTGS
jgi:hypothetical protein